MVTLPWPLPLGAAARGSCDPDVCGCAWSGGMRATRDIGSDQIRSDQVRIRLAGTQCGCWASIACASAQGLGNQHQVGQEPACSNDCMSHVALLPHRVTLSVTHLSCQISHLVTESVLIQDPAHEPLQRIKQQVPDGRPDPCDDHVATADRMAYQVMQRLTVPQCLV
jgi:hypothetical protein